MFNARLAIFAPLVLVAACATQPNSTPVSVADTIARDPNLSTLSGLVVKAGLSDTLKAAGPYTVFAPTNDAFKSVPAKTMDELAANPARLKAVLSYHVLPAKVTAAQVKPGNAKTAQGANIALSKAGEFVTVEDAMVQKADIMATNGVVHTVDRVLMPPAAR
ncbi:fasciclin domain-containing protein [Caenimonas sp. SL110]|uniref:fasciclin domain-containing protein n=1 Tax=Caenimonas sp. SL110 TaxID=1450524 RepID=UPI000654B2C7|nr:fasciclin domain-containing protein [Caenimonas sp. SL110]